MFTFAQYVLGIGKSIDERPIENNSTNQSLTSTVNNNSVANRSNDCSLTNIENDWILINNVDENEQQQSDSNKVDKIVQKQTNHHASNKKSIAIKNSGQDFSGTNVQRPNLTKNDCHLTANVNVSKQCQQSNNQPEQTTVPLQSEKHNDNEQLIDERIFDNLFVKKPPFLSPVKTEQAKKLILLKIKNSANNNKNFGNKENLPLNRSKRNNKSNKNGTENLVNTGRAAGGGSASLTLNSVNKNGKKNGFLFGLNFFYFKCPQLA